jgi:chromosome segregation ATPase
VTELKVSVFDRITREIGEKTKLKKELENNVNILNNRYKLSTDRLSDFKNSNTNVYNNTTKMEYYNDRVSRENFHMDMELPMIKKRIETMKNEMFDKDRESRQMKYQIYRAESEVVYLQEETRRMGKKVIDMQEEKKNLMTAIVLMKKQTDMMKERVIREDGKTKGLISDVSILLSRGKVGY